MGFRPRPPRLQTALVALVSWAFCLPSAIAQVYESPVENQRLESGVPLGGVGCGKIEYLTDGGFGSFTGNGNWDRPVTLLPLSFLAIATTDANGKRVARALALGDPAGVKSVETVRFDGVFPRATALFEDPALPFTVEVRAASSFHAGNLEASTVPGALLSVELIAPANTPLPAAQLFLAFENLAGVGGTSEIDFTDRTGSYAEPFSDGAVTGIRFATRRSDDGPRQNAIGTAAIAARVRAEGGSVQALGTFNGNGDGRELVDAIEHARTAMDFGTPGIEGESHPGGLIQIQLPQSQEGRSGADLSIGWHAPHLFTQFDEGDHGKPYLDRFDDAAAVSTWLVQNAPVVHSRSTALERTFRDSTLPEWMVRKLMNSLCPLFSNSVLTRDLVFGTLESPVTMRGALGTMDQRLSSHAAYSFLFPFLDMRELESFAILQLPRGQITHFSGNVHMRMRSPNVPYGISGWPDLSCSFVLQVDALARWTGNTNFLAAMRSHVDRALDWVHSVDNDGDGIPEGGTTFDNRLYEGSLSYTASVYLAALSAGARIADRFNDSPRADALRSRADQRRTTLIDSMWNGRWFEKAHDPASGLSERDCFMAQLAGEFRASIQSLPPTVPPAMSLRASMSLLEQNAAPNRPMPVIDIAPGGREAWSADTWVQYTETYLLQQLIQQGFAEQGLDRLRSIAEAQRFRDRNPWNVALVYDSLTGQRKWGEQYMTTTAAWFLPRVLTGMDIDRLDEATRGATLTIDPRVPAAWESFRIPVHSPDLVLNIGYDASGPDRHRRIALTALPGSRKTSVGRLILGLPPGTTAEHARLLREDGQTLVSGQPSSPRPGRVGFTLDPPMQLNVDEEVELFLIDPRSGVLDLSDGQPRSLGASVTITQPTAANPQIDAGELQIKSSRDTRWPQVVRLPEAPPQALVGPWLPRSISETDRHPNLLAILPPHALSTRERSWLRAMSRPPWSSEAAAIERDALSMEELLLSGDGTWTTPSEKDRKSVHDRFDELFARVGATRASAHRRRVYDEASDAIPVSFKGSFLGNTISDRTLRVRAIIDVPMHRWRLDSLHAAAPDGVRIVTQPNVSRSTLSGQVHTGPLEVSWILDMDDAARWRRSAFEIEIRGTLMANDEVSFERDHSISIGYEFVKEFLTLGPFPLQPDAERLDSQLGPEPGSMTAIRFKPKTPPWRKMDTVFEGILNLRDLTPPTILDAACFACVEFESPDDRDARLYFGTGSAIRIWMNNEIVHSNEELRYAAPGQDSVDIRLRKGRNRALFKIAGPRDRLSLLLELTDRNGTSMPDVSFELPQ